VVAAPRATIDFAAPDGNAIVVEVRPGHEVTTVHGVAMAPRGSTAANPAFDVTPAALVHAIVTEHGVVTKPSRRALAQLRRIEGADREKEKGPE
jgi:methylthioribose-1-phosphate isomerase